MTKREPNSKASKASRVVPDPGQPVVPDPGQPVVPDGATNPFRTNRTWARMLADALRGVRVAAGREPNFIVHALAAAAAIGLGSWLGLSLERWCLIALCIALVLAAEMANTAFEHLARAVTRDEHPEVRDALDVASAAVLVVAIGAAVVGAIVVVWPLIQVD